MVVPKLVKRDEQPRRESGVSKGTESYTLLRGDEQILKAGDMMISDGMGVVSSIVYGPDQRTQITDAT